MAIADEDAATAHVGELQLHMRPVYNLKELAHAAYGIVRGTDYEHER